MFPNRPFFIFKIQFRQYVYLDKYTNKTINVVSIKKTAKNVLDRKELAQDWRED